MNMATMEKGTLKGSVWLSVSLVLFCMFSSANAATEAECAQKLLTFGLTLNNTPDCSGFLDAVQDMTATNCTYIAQDKRQFCWDTFAAPFGEILKECQNFMEDDQATGDNVETQENAEIDPCYTPEQYSSLLVNAFAGMNTGNESEKELACQNDMLAIIMDVQSDQRCTTFMEAFDAEECPIAEADREYCWKEYSDPFAGLIKKCALHMTDEDESVEESKKEVYDNQCYTRDQLSIFEDAYVTAMENSATIFGLHFFLKYILSVIVFILPFF